MGCVLASNANFVNVASNSNKAKLKPDNLDVEEWDENSGAMLRFFENNPFKDMKRNDENVFYCELVCILVQTRVYLTIRIHPSGTKGLGESGQ
jgi:hypothetical protein